MGASNYQDQEANIPPPRVGFVIVQAVSQTSQGYDMTKLVFQDEDISVSSAGTGVQNQVWLDFHNDGANTIYFAFDSAAPGTNTIDDTQINSAGTAWTRASNTSGFTYGGSATVFPPGGIPSGTIRPVRVDRRIDLTLILKCSSGNTSTLRITPSSQSMPGATKGA